MTTATQSKTIALSAVTPEFASAKIIAFAQDGRLEQGKWHGRRADGQQIACLLGSIHPKINAAVDCPASLMPQWLARLTISLFDRIPTGQVGRYGLAYGASVARWGALDADAWERIRKAFIIGVFGGAIDDATVHIGDATPALWPEIKAMAESVQALLLRDAPRQAYRELLPEARRLREAARAARSAARRTAAVVEAVAVVAAVAAVAAVVVAVVVAAVVVAAVAAVVVAVEVVAAEEVEVVAARRESYAKSFDILLKVIDDELA